jgi:hypothetical protein
MSSSTQQQTSSSTTAAASSSSSVILTNDFIPATHVNYLKAKTNKSGGKSVGIRLMLELPLMLTWGAQKFVDEVTGRTTYKMSLQFPRNEYSTPETDVCLKKFIELENKIKADATTNSMEWFNRPKDKMPAQVVDALFHPMLTWTKDPATGERDMTKSPTLNIKLENYDGFNCEIYDVNEKLLFPNKDDPEITPLTLIPKAINTACVIQCGGIWFAGGKFGVTWKLFQCVVQPRPSLKGKCLIHLAPEVKKELIKKSATENDDEEESQPTPTTTTQNVPLEIAEDSDVEDTEPVEKATTRSNAKQEPEPVTAPEPVAAEPPKKVVKKVIRKKTA